MCDSTAVILLSAIVNKHTEKKETVNSAATTA